MRSKESKICSHSRNNFVFPSGGADAFRIARGMAPLRGKRCRASPRCTSVVRKMNGIDSFETPHEFVCPVEMVKGKHPCSGKYKNLTDLYTERMKRSIMNFENDRATLLDPIGTEEKSILTWKPIFSPARVRT